MINDWLGLLNIEMLQIFNLNYLKFCSSYSYMAVKPGPFELILYVIICQKRSFWVWQQDIFRLMSKMKIYWKNTNLLEQIYLNKSDRSCETVEKIRTA